MTSHTLIRLTVLASLLATCPGRADTAVPASGTTAAATASSTIEVPVGTTAAASVSAPAAATVSAASAAPAAATTAQSASAAPTAATTAPAIDAQAQPAAAPAPAVEVPAPAPAPAYAPANPAGTSLPVRGMNMENVEHIFGTPLHKDEAVGKPPITRWDYADYVVYFEYNMVLHTVMKSGPFSDSKAPPDGNG